MPARGLTLFNNTLAFEGGDVIFHTSHRPIGIFVLHQAVLTSKSGFFRSLFAERWGNKPHELVEEGPKVFELDLQLDFSTGYALPTIRKRNEKSVEDLGSSVKDILPSPMTDNAHADSKITTSECSATLALWNTPKDPKYNEQKNESRESLRKRRRDAYLPFYHTYADAMIPLDSPDNNAAFGQWTERNFHKHMLNFVRDVWRCLILFIYGKKITFNEIKNWRQILTLLATVRAYAELLDVSEEIVDNIRLTVTETSSLSGLVRKEPFLFFKFSYYMRMPKFYKAATKCLVVQSYPKPLTKLIARYGQAYFDEHNLALLMAARMQYDDAVQNLREFFFEGLPQIDPQTSRLHPKRHVRQLFECQLFTVFNDFSKPVTFFGNKHSTGFEAIGELLRLSCQVCHAGGPCCPAAVAALGLSSELVSLPQTYRKEFEKVLRHTLGGFRSVGFLDFSIPFYRDGTPKYSCLCTRKPDSKGMVAIRFEDLFMDREIRPWPLGSKEQTEIASDFDHEETSEPVSGAHAGNDGAPIGTHVSSDGGTVTAPATRAFLTTLGLDKTFEKHLRSNRLTWEELGAETQKWGWIPSRADIIVGESQGTQSDGVKVTIPASWNSGWNGVW